MIVSFDARTGTDLGKVDESSPAEVGRVVRAAAEAAGSVAAASPRERTSWLGALAHALEVRQDDLAMLADGETGLGMDRLRGEVLRAAGQLRFYADVAVEGSYLGVARDDGDQAASGLVRVNQPLGCVAVFGASNFPFAFGVVGNDTGAALASGCPVVAKGHLAHPRLSEELRLLAVAALEGAGAPSGTFGMVHGQQAGIGLVRAPEIRAVAFTGSQGGGLALWRLANEREQVIPVYAEMGTVNPVVVTREAASTRTSEIARGFVGSFTLGSGQFCTKPGIIFAPAGHQMALEVAEALQRLAPEPVMLTETIASNVKAGVRELVDAGASVVAEVGGSGSGWSAGATVLTAPVSALRSGSRLLGEVFGAVAVVVEYAHPDELTQALANLQPSLAASLFTGGVGDEEGPRIVHLLSSKVGRVAVDEWPTGVAFTWAQQHGGPWPSTSAPHATSVGAAALDRFVRPVAFQGTPEEWLPPAARASNPWSVPRRVNGVLETLHG